MATVAHETIGTQLADILRHRQLLWSLAWRDVRIRYKQSLLGIAWAVLLPLAMMLVFTFVFTRAIDVRGLPDVGMPYAVYAYLGLVPWTFFSTSLAGCVNSLVSNRNLVTKVYFPREVFPLASIGSALVDFLIAGVVLGALMVYFNLAEGWRFTLTPALLALPLIVAVQVVLSLGLGLLLSMANLFYRDVRQLFSVAIQLAMFVSGVVVPIPSDGSLTAQVLALNPMVSIIDAYRRIIADGALPAPVPLAWAAGVSVLTLLVGGYVFRRAAHRFAEVI
jgi:ABC-type polysaccharide/polyol phosphate export permease